MPNDNPYAPPQTPIEAPPASEPSRSVPLVVVLAIVGLGLWPIAIDAWNLVGRLPSVTTGEAAAVNLLLDAASIVLLASFVFMLWRRRNWARFVVSAWVVVSALNDVALLMEMWPRPDDALRLYPDWSQLILWLSKPVLGIASIVLLFTPAAARWFRRA